MSQLTIDQQERIKQYVEGFKVFVKTEKGLEWEQDRKNKTQLIQKLLRKENVLNLTEEDLAKIWCQRRLVESIRRALLYIQTIAEITSNLFVDSVIEKS